MEVCERELAVAGQCRACLTCASATGQGFGSKTIGSVAGSMLLLNNMMGVGLPLLPMLVQQAGWVTPIITILFVAVMSGLSATMLTESMKYLPGTCAIAVTLLLCDTLTLDHNMYKQATVTLMIVSSSRHWQSSTSVAGPTWPRKWC